MESVENAMLSRDHPRRCGDKQCLSFLLIRKQDHPLECGDMKRIRIL